MVYKQKENKNEPERRIRFNYENRNITDAISDNGVWYLFNEY